MDACGTKVNTIMNDGRNVVPKPNADGKILLENWVEERATKQYDEHLSSDRMKQLKQTHKGLLSVDEHAPEWESVTHHDYKGLPPEERFYIGYKQLDVERALYEKIRKEINADVEWKPEPMDYRSVTTKDFYYMPEPKQPCPPIRPINIVREQPMTYWTEYRDRIHGNSAVKARDTPFRKNTAFSTPIGESWNQTKPYEIENWPKM